MVFVGRGFTGCGKSDACHSERSEESLCGLDLERREILSFAQNDTKSRVFPQPVQPQHLETC
jgi:hypothetical protein